MLQDGHTETDIVLVQLHIAQRLIYYFHHELPSLEASQSSSFNLKTLEALGSIMSELLQQTDRLFTLALDFSLPKCLHYCVCHTLDLLLSVPFSTLRLQSDQQPLLVTWNTFFIPALQSFFSTSLSALSSSNPTNHVLPLSNILCILATSLQRHIKGRDLDLETSTLICAWLTEGGPLYYSFISLVVSLSEIEDLYSFQTLAPVCITIAKRCLSFSPSASPRISECVLLRLLLDGDDEDHIRDLSIARKLYSLLKREFELSATSGNFAKISPKFLSCIQRVIPVLFSYGPLPSHSNTHASSKSLVSSSYMAEEKELAGEGDDEAELRALQRSVVLYGLSVCGRVLTSDVDPETSIASQMMMLARTMAGRGIFSVNPTPLFFELFGDHDENLMEALYWLQIMLAAHYPPHHQQQQKSHELLKLLRSKVSQLEPLLGVLNPHYLFVSFLTFINYDHSLLMDFMLSSESTWVLMYLLDYVKICISDWDRTFVTLYNLKKKKMKHHDTRTRTKTQRGDEAQTDASPTHPVKLLPEDVDSLLEVLLSKQIEELRLEQEQKGSGDHGQNLRSDNLTSSIANDVQPLTNHSHQLSAESIDCLLRTATESENEFDAVISTLIRLLFHLESAQEHGLIGYNVEPLLMRLRELESKYEKQEGEDGGGD